MTRPAARIGRGWGRRAGGRGRGRRGPEPVGSARALPPRHAGRRSGAAGAEAEIFAAPGWRAARRCRPCAREEHMARVAFIADDLFEDSELRVPWDRLRQAGHEVVLVGLEAGKRIEGKKQKETFTTDLAAKDARAEEFDALVVPGGNSPDRIRTSIDMVRLVRGVFTAGKPVAAVCHGPWLLVEADALDGRTVTSWPSLKTDLINAGARWVDRAVVEDENVITSRNPGDLDAFSDAILRQLEEAARAEG